MKDIPSINFFDGKQQVRQDPFTDKYYKNFLDKKKQEKNIKDIRQIYENVNFPDKYKEGIIIKDKEVIQRIHEKEVRNKIILLNKIKPQKEDKKIKVLNYLTKRETLEEDQESGVGDYFKQKNELIFEDPNYLKEEVNDIFKNYKKIGKEAVLMDRNLFDKRDKRVKLTLNRVIKNDNTMVHADNLLTKTYSTFTPDFNWWDKIYVKKGFRQNIESQGENKILKKDHFALNTNDNTEQLKDSKSSIQKNDLNKFEDIKIIDFPLLPIVNKEEKNLALPFFYTEDELKKIKKKEKLEKQQEIQEKIKYGIIQPPPPKMKLSNFAKIFENEAILNPTKIEKIVRNQIEERKTQHLIHNENKKLNKELKEEKKIRKIKRDMSKQLYLNIFLLQSLPDFDTIFKIEQYITKFYFNGFLMIPSKNFEVRKSLLVFECGKKYGDKFEKYLNKIFHKQNSKKDKNLNIEDNEKQMNTKNIRKIWTTERKDHVYKNWRILRPKSFAEIETSFKDYAISDVFPIFLNQYRNNK